MTVDSSETKEETESTTTEAATEKPETPATVPAEATTPKPSDTTTTKPSETEATAPAETTTTTTTKAVTTAKPKPATTTTAATTKPTPEWTESKASGTKYVNTDCYSRKKAVLGADTVKLYSVNDKVTVTANTDTGYFKLSDGSFMHSDYLSDNKVAQTTTTTKKAEAPKPATSTTKKQESKPKSIYEYPFDLEAIKQVIVNDAVNNYGLINDDDPNWTPEGSSWSAPTVISKDMNTNIIKRNVNEIAEANFIWCQMKKGDYFKVYIETIPDLKKDENGNSIEGYAIYFLRCQAGDDGNPRYP